MRKERVLLRRILFSYREKPTNNFLGTDGSGDSMVIFQDGALEYRHFLCGKESPVAVDSYPANPGLAEDVREILEKSRPALEQMPSRIDNDTRDGTWEIFRFLGKEVTIDNLNDYGIQRDKSVIAETGFAYLPEISAEDEQFRKIIVWNAVLLNLRKEVAAVLKTRQFPLLMEYPYRGRNGSIAHHI